MTKTMWFGLFLVGMVVTSGAWVQTSVIDQIVTGRQVADANGSNTAFPSRIAATLNGNLVISDNSVSSNERVYLIDVGVSPPKLTLITDANALKNKVDVVNGAAPAPTTLTIQGVGVDEDGQIIIASDFSGSGSTETGLVFRVNPQTKEIVLLAGLDGPAGLTSVEGIATIAVRKRTVYVVLEAGFGAVNGDSVVTVSVDAPDGGLTPTRTLVPESAFRALEGPTDPLAFRVIGFLPSGNFVLANSATSAATQNLLEIDTTTGAVRVLVAASDIAADLRVMVIGPTGGGIDPDGVIYLTNEFGDQAIRNSIIAVRNAGGGKGDASLVATSSQLLASNLVDINGTRITSLSIQRGGSVSPGAKTLVFIERNSRSLVRVREMM